MFELGSGFQVKTLSISKRGLEYFDDYTNLRGDKTDQIIEGNVHQNHESSLFSPKPSD